MTITVQTTNQDGTDPQWIDQYGQVTGWKHTWTFPGGPTSASFQFTAPYRFQHRAVQPGRLLYAYQGTALAWSGRLEQPRRGQPWDMTGTGLAAFGKDYTAATTNINALNATVDASIGSGLPWTRVGTLTEPTGTAAKFAGTIDTVLGTLVTQGGFWQLDAHGNLTTPTGPPTTPTFLLFASDVPGGRTFDNYANVLGVIYLNSGAGGARATLTLNGPSADKARWGRYDQQPDLTAGGAMTTTQATTIGNAILAKYADGPAWNEALTVGEGQVFTPAGVKPDLALMQAGCLVRVLALDPDTFGTGQQTADIPVGQVDYDDTTRTVQLTPLVSARDDITSLLAKYTVQR